MDILFFSYHKQSKKIQAYLKHKQSLLHEKYFNETTGLKYELFMQKQYIRITNECKKYNIFLVIEFENWCDLIENIAYRFSHNPNNSSFSFMNLITAAVDSHYKLIRENKIKVTGALLIYRINIGFFDENFLKKSFGKSVERGFQYYMHNPLQ